MQFTQPSKALYPQLDELIYLFWTQKMKSLSGSMPYLIQLNSHSPQVSQSLSHHSVNHPPTSTSQLSTKSVQILFFDLAKATHCKLVVIIHDDGLLMNKKYTQKPDNSIYRGNILHVQPMIISSIPQSTNSSPLRRRQGFYKHFARVHRPPGGWYWKYWFWRWDQFALQYSTDISSQRGGGGIRKAKQPDRHYTAI